MMQSFDEFQYEHPRESGECRSDYMHRTARAYADEVLTDVQYDENKDPRAALVALCEVIRALHYL